MADVPPRLPPDPLLRIQFRSIGRKRDKFKTVYFSEVGAGEPSFMPRRTVPEDRDSFSRIQTPQVSQMTNGCSLILSLAPRRMLFTRTKIDGPIETDFFLSRICFDNRCFAPLLPDGGKRCLKEERCLVFRENDRTLLFQNFQFFLTSISHFLTTAGFCSRYCF